MPDAIKSLWSIIHPLQSSTKRSDSGRRSEKLNGPPEAAEVIVVGKDRVLLIMKPGRERKEYVPQGKCYLRE